MLNVNTGQWKGDKSTALGFPSGISPPSVCGSPGKMYSFARRVVNNTLSILLHTSGAALNPSRAQGILFSAWRETCVHTHSHDTEKLLLLRPDAGTSITD